MGKIARLQLANLQIIRHICITLQTALLAEYTVSASYSSDRLRGHITQWALLADWQVLVGGGLIVSEK